MADKPLYYGGGKSSPMYYGAQQPAYGGKSPMYYGAGRQYGGVYGGVYGGAYGAYGGTPPGATEEEGVVGKLTAGRILRVLSQRWLSVFVFLLVGLIVSFAVYSISPEIYEATSEFTMDTRRMGSSQGNSAIEQAMVDYGNTYVEIFNTRLPQWRSEAIIQKIKDAYRAKSPSSTVTDDEIVSTIAGSEIELQRNSRVISISVRSRNRDLAMALANAYVQAIDQFTEEENKARCDKAVRQIHEQVDKTRKEREQISADLQEFKTMNKVATLTSQRSIVEQSITAANQSIIELEDREKELDEWEKLLTNVQKDPDRFGALTANVPRAQEIATEYSAYQKASGEYETLLRTFTDEHEEVIRKGAERENAKQRFLDATSRAHEAGSTMLAVTRNRLAAQREKLEQLQAEFASLSQHINIAEAGLSTKESEYKIAGEVFQRLILEEQTARREAESTNEKINPGRPATLPFKPVLPNAVVIFGVGVAVALVLGLVFILVLDNLEDTVVNLSDIEGRLALKVLAVFPHVRRKKREHVAMFTVEDKYSQFSEAVAGLRNLLDSPRYEAMTHSLLVISTQPGEGKTITSTSIAISYAQTGRKVLHVDFDLRRPRLARIWGLELTQEKSFSHCLQAANGAKVDFDALVSKSSVEGLDVICSLPPDGVSPSTIFGSSVIQEFFAWARASYDRIIVDSPPYGLVGDVVSLSVLVDSVIIMCCPDRTHFKPIQYCSRSLTEAGANILGVIVNDVEMSSASAFSPGTHHRYGYGYGYGDSYGYGRYGYSPGRERRGDGDNPAEEPAGGAPAAPDGSPEGAADAAAGADSSAPPVAIAPEDDELADEE